MNEDDEPLPACPKCDGDGQVHVLCEQRVQKCYCAGAFWDWKSKPCPLCDGTGVQDK